MKSKQRGFTLVELVMVIMFLFGASALGGILVFTTVHLISKF